MKTAMVSSSAWVLITSLSVVFAPVASASKTGFYGGLGVGAATIEFNTKDFVDQFVHGGKVDIGRYKELVYFAVSEFNKNNSPSTLVLPDIPDDVISIKIGDQSTIFDTNEIKNIIDNQLGSTAFQQTLFSNPDKNNYVMRAFGGYQVNRFFGIELGGFVTSTVTFNSPDIVTCFDTVLCQKNPPPKSPSPEYLTHFSFTDETTLSGVELLATASLPLDPFFAYVKAGIAYVDMRSESKLKLTGKLNDNKSVLTDIDFTVKDDDHSGRGRPVMAAGIAYRVTNDIVVDLSYQRYNFKSNKNKKSSNSLFKDEDLGNQPTMGQFLLNVSVQFGTDKCGDLNC